MLRIYLGAAPGVGKTFAMLNEGWRRRSRGTDVVIGLVETHGRPTTAAQIRDLPVVEPRRISYRSGVFEELDVEAVLERRPSVALVDEIAHSNVPGSRNEKRWQDVDELLAAGIDVISTMNIQHLASINDVVEQITGVPERETVPDAVIRAADQIELVDMSPEALRRRMAHGNVYRADQIDTAQANYFRVGNLSALRELALLWVADRVDDQLADYRSRHGIAEPWETRERVVVALGGGANSDRVIQRAARTAARTRGELIGVHVRVPGHAPGQALAELEAQRRLLGELDGRFVEVTGRDPAEALVEFARAANTTQLYLGATSRSRWSTLLRGSVINRVVRNAGQMDVHVLAGAEASPSPLSDVITRLSPGHSLRQRLAAWLLATLGIAAVSAALSTLHTSLGLASLLVCMLPVVLGIASIGGPLPAVTGVVVAALAADFFFAPPLHTLRIAGSADGVALALFAVVALAMIVLVGRFARRSVELSRARSEADLWARLATRTVSAGVDDESAIVEEIRETLALDAAAVLSPVDGTWHIKAASGHPVPNAPESASYCAELDDEMLLVVGGPAPEADDIRVLNVFVNQLRLAQRRRHLELQAASAAALEQADSARSALLAAVSHDLRTPLASIKAAATSLLGRDVVWSVDQVRDFAGLIDCEADRLTALVSNLLDLRRLQVGALPVSPRPVPIDEVLHAAVISLHGDTSGIALDVPAGLPLVDVDPGLLERALANVMDNARRWSPPATAVRVEAGVIGDRLEVRVIDRGPGVPEKERDRIFLPFQRLGDGGRDAGAGVGLGLAVARGFTEAISGELTLEDTPGGGTTMVFSLRSASG